MEMNLPLKLRTLKSSEGSKTTWVEQIGIQNKYTDFRYYKIFLNFSIENNLKKVKCLMYFCDIKKEKKKKLTMSLQDWVQRRLGCLAFDGHTPVQQHLVERDMLQFCFCLAER